ncbi:MAG: glycosyltransferase family 39 protein [Pseudomonadota bacterium]|nr:glycosyltransferase family 39 protein [Pseudomonadota bacterium]
MPPSRRMQAFIFLALAVAGVLPTLLAPGSTVGDGVDAFGTHWFYWWIRTAVERLGNPSHTTLFFYPFGKDIFAHTGNNFVDAVFSVPFQWVFGGTFYSPMWIIALQLGNVLTFRPLARYLFGGKEGTDTFTAFAATVLWQVNPFVLFEITAGRPTQAMVWFLPAAVLYLLRTAREPGWKNSVWFGLAVAMSAWTYWFTAYFLLLLLVPLAIVELRRAPDRRAVLKRWSLGAAICLLLVAPGVSGMSAAVDDGRVPGIDPSPGSIFVPPQPIANNVSADLHGLWLMEMYGSPLFFQPAWLLPLLVVPFLRKLPIPGGRWPWLAALGTVLAFAGGTMFRVGDFTVVMPHYMALYRYLPFFDRLWFPYRMAAVAFIPAALLVAALCAMLPRPRLALAALVALGLAGQFAVGTWPFNHRYTRAPPMVASLKDEGGGVIFLPMKIQHDGLMWQTEFQLPTFGGMGESAGIFWPEKFRKRLNNSLIKALRGAAITPAQPKNVLKKDRVAIEKDGFRWVILRRSLLESELRRQLDMAPGSFDKYVRIQETIDAVSGVIGSSPVGVDGDSVLWDLRGTFQGDEAWAPTPERLQSRGWEEYGRTVYEQKLEKFGRTGSVRERSQPVLPK